MSALLTNSRPLQGPFLAPELSLACPFSGTVDQQCEFLTASAGCQMDLAALGSALTQTSFLGQEARMKVKAWVTLNLPRPRVIGCN